MKRCIQLAKNGFGTTYPNPLVGSVIVHNGKIIGEGWHQKPGDAHAEVNAINSVIDKNRLTDSTIYVSLEPCSHFGRTPPCSDLIIKHRIPRVVIGTIDPNILVGGKGIAKLTDAGIHVDVGISEQECNALNVRFFTYHNKKRPYIILKYAQSTDGFIAPLRRDDQKPVWITNQYSRQLVHKWRTQEQAILVGTQTAIDDNPRLNARDWNGNNPVRIVIDRNNRIPKESHIFDNEATTIVISGNDFAVADDQMCKKIVDLLYDNGITSLIIEGGQKTLQLFIDAELWDEARIFRGAMQFGEGVKAPVLEGRLVQKMGILGDELLIYKK